MPVACPRILLVLVATLTVGCQTFAPTVAKSHSPHPASPVAALTHEDHATAAPEKPSVWQKRRFRSLVANAEKLERDGKSQEAISAYKQALEKIEDPEILHRVALLCQVHDQEADARRYFERCLKLDPANPELLADAGYRAYLAGDLDVARTHYQAAVAVAPDSPRVLSNYAILMHARGDNERALELFERAGCSRQEALANVGELYRMDRDDEQADQYLQLARSLETPSEIQPAGLVSMKRSPAFASHSVTR